MGRQVGKIHSLPQGDALGWENGRAFGPHNDCQEILPCAEPRGQSEACADENTMKTGTGTATNSGSRRAVPQAVAEPVPVFIGPVRARRRRGLAPLEFVMALPILLFVMALMINFGTVAVWKVRAWASPATPSWANRSPYPTVDSGPNDDFCTTANLPPPSFWPGNVPVPAALPEESALDGPRVTAWAQWQTLFPTRAIR